MCKNYIIKREIKWIVTLIISVRVIIKAVTTILTSVVIPTKTIKLIRSSEETIGIMWKRINE